MSNPEKTDKSTTGPKSDLKKRHPEAENHQEALIDEAVEESMDASDPPAPKHIT